jgi:hypothetical protein
VAASAGSRGASGAQFDRANHEDINTVTTKPRRYFVPAGPGFWRLDLVHPRALDGEFKVSREPVLAWEMRPGVDLPNVNFFAHPVKMVWSPYRDAVLAIREPDGVVRLTNGASFASEAEWLSDAKADERTAS